MDQLRRRRKITKIEQNDDKHKEKDLQKEGLEKSTPSTSSGGTLVKKIVQKKKMEKRSTELTSLSDSDDETSDEGGYSGDGLSKFKTKKRSKNRGDQLDYDDDEEKENADKPSANFKALSNNKGRTQSAGLRMRDTNVSAQKSAAVKKAEVNPKKNIDEASKSSTPQQTRRLHTSVLKRGHPEPKGNHESDDDEESPPKKQQIPKKTKKMSKKDVIRIILSAPEQVVYDIIPSMNKYWRCVKSILIEKVDSGYVRCNGCEELLTRQKSPEFIKNHLNAKKCVV